MNKDNSYYDYIVKLFYQYCLDNNADLKKVKEYLKISSFYNIYDLIDSNPEFKDWIEQFSELRENRYNYLRNTNCINDSTIELNKGIHDTVISKDSDSISIFADTYGKENSVLYSYNKRLFKFLFNGERKLLPENRTFILDNPMSTNELKSVLEKLSGTNSYLVLGYWGVPFDNLKNRKMIFMDYFKNYLDKLGIKYLEDCSDNNYLYMSTIIFNTKMLNVSKTITKNDVQIYDKSKIYYDKYIYDIINDSSTLVDNRESFCINNSNYEDYYSENDNILRR